MITITVKQLDQGEAAGGGRGREDWGGDRAERPRPRGRNLQSQSLASGFSLARPFHSWGAACCSLVPYPAGADAAPAL